jgi:hypothetical protein
MAEVNEAHWRKARSPKLEIRDHQIRLLFSWKGGRLPVPPYMLMSLAASHLSHALRRSVNSVKAVRGTRPLVSKPTKMPTIARRGLFTSKSTQVEANVHAFGRLVKAAVVEKGGKQKSGIDESFKASKVDFGSEATELFLQAKKADAESSIGSERDRIRADFGTLQEGSFDANIAKQKAIVDAAGAHANEPMFSLRAQAKAYELHKINACTLLTIIYISLNNLSNYHSHSIQHDYR